jgi:hypothetical protein
MDLAAVIADTEIATAHYLKIWRDCERERMWQDPDLPISPTF